MGILIFSISYVAHIFLCRYLTYLSVRNQGKFLTITYEAPFLWFVPGIGTLWCLFDFLASLNHVRGVFTGKNWEKRNP